MNPKVDTYLVEGCMRCSLGGTTACKVHKWHNELVKLREIVLDCGLTEDFKWKQPTYTFNGNNVLIVTCFNDFACIALFKGALIRDEQGLLKAPGENSQASRRFEFTSVEQIEEIEPIIKAYIFEAIELEKAGAKVEFKKQPEPMPEELEQALANDAAYKDAFDALTPGRQRSYILYISQAKQAATRASRAEKCKPKVFAGKGWNEY